MHAVPSHPCVSLPMQELKSKQPGLPAAVAALVISSGWLDTPRQCSTAQHNNTARHHFSVPGLTITSFHLDQLHASVQVAGPRSTRVAKMIMSVCLQGEIRMIQLIV